MLALSLVSLALSPNLPKLPTEQVGRPVVEIRRAASVQQLVPLTAAFVSSMPTAALALAGQSGRGVADYGSSGGGGFDIIGSITNLALSGILLAAFAFIGKYALDAVSEVGKSAAAVAEEMAKDDGTPQAPVSNEPLFDDSGTGADNSPVTKRSKKRLVTNEEIARMAPWMAAKIDQDAIDKAKALRKKKKEAGK